MLNKKPTMLTFLLMIMGLAACGLVPEPVPAEGTELCIGTGRDAVGASP